MPADAYSELGNLSIHWESTSITITDTGPVRQEVDINGESPHALLIFDSFNEEMNGEYTCFASNTHSDDDQAVTVIGKLAYELGL